MLKTALLAMLALSQAAGAGAGAAGVDRLATVEGDVRDFGSEPDDWLRLGGMDARLLIPPGDDRSRFWELIDAAAAQGESPRVRIDAAAGRLAPTGDHLVYRICSLTVPGQGWIGSESRNCPAAPAAEAESERLLALGVAHVQQRPREAREILSAALLASPRLTDRAAALALKARAQAASWLSVDYETGSRDQDRLLVEALGDYRRLAELVPENGGVRLAIAETLRALGAYDEAERIYRDTALRWPDSAFEVAVQSAALHREQGEYARSLRRLDEYALTGDPNVEGMKYNYHRAWTLGAMGRDEEAVRHLDQGLRNQPDYHSAYLMRACLHARGGRLVQALADQRAAFELLNEVGAEPGRWFHTQAQRSLRSIEVLERAIAQGEVRTVELPCEAFWRDGARPRARSPLLSGG